MGVWALMAHVAPRSSTYWLLAAYTYSIRRMANNHIHISHIPYVCMCVQVFRNKYLHYP